MSSRNVTFKLDSDQNTSINSKSTFSLIKQKRRNSKATTSSIEKTRSRSLNRHSISSNKTNNLFRIDAFGNEILKGNKNHKISFIDMISSQRIAEVILIDNFDSVFENKYNDNKENCQCSACEIF